MGKAFVSTESMVRHNKNTDAKDQLLHWCAQRSNGLASQPVKKTIFLIQKRR